MAVPSPVYIPDPSFFFHSYTQAIMKPTVKPGNPNFSSGPCSKRPGYNVANLQLDSLGRSHRSALGKKLLGLACSETARLLNLPEGYRVAVVPGSDTGAVEMAMWSLLGARGVDVLAWESFGSGWVTDIVKQLKLPNVSKLEALHQAGGRAPQRPAGERGAVFLPEPGAGARGAARSGVGRPGVVQPRLPG